jgi:8-hydroxy-5-deazaflavin:NADPH oxidoreductase
VDVGILGGTGPAGRGLAVRLAAAGVHVTLGSRDEERAASVAGDLGAQWGERLRTPVVGGANALAAECETVVVATPWDSAIATVRPLAEALSTKVVVSMANALAREGKEMLALIVPRGSVAAHVQAALPKSQVAAAFHHLPAQQMQDLDASLDADVLVCSDHRSATEVTSALAGQIEGLRALDAGSLAQAAAIEAFTAVCITLNIRHRAHSSVKMAGI